MININSYVSKFGNRTFEEFPFNDVDGLIFAELSMINFELLFGDDDSVVFKDIVINDLKKTIYGSPDANANGVLLKRMMNSNRYMNTRACFVRRSFNETNANQFYAVTFILPTGDFYISFKGTDITIVGWREDLILTVSDRIPSCDQALEYCNEVISKLKGKFIIGGHSKGGHLAVYAGLHINQEYLDRLLTIYSYDGPGFPEGIESFPNYELVKDKVEKLITHRDMVGLLYDEMKDYKIVYSPGVLLGGHDPFTWKIDENYGEFITRNDITRRAKIFARGANMWINQLSVDDKSLGIKALIALVGNAKDIYGLLKYLGQNIMRYNSVIKQFPYEDREKLRAMINSLFDCFKIAKLSYSKKGRNGIDIL